MNVSRLSAPLVVAAAFGLGALTAWTFLTPRTSPVRSLAELPPPGAESYVQRSLTLLNAAQYAQAKLLVEQGLIHHPGNPTLRNNLGVALLQNGEIGRGHAVFAELSRDLPDDELARNNLAWAERLRQDALSRLAAAESILSSADADNETRITALTDKAYALRTLQRTTDAAAVFAQIAASKPDDAEAQNMAGIAFMEDARPQEALAAFRDAERLRPDVALYANNIRWAEAEMRKTNGAAVQ